MSTTPTRNRPDLPDGYGLPASTAGMLTWDQVEERLAASPVYWMATVRPDGRPHVVPRWGVWLDGCLWYDGSPETVNARNLADDPRCVLHLENGTEAVIIEGEAVVNGDPGPRFRARLAEAFAKYHDMGYAPGPRAGRATPVPGCSSSPRTRRSPGSRSRATPPGSPSPTDRPSIWGAARLGRACSGNHDLVLSDPPARSSSAKTPRHDWLVGAPNRIWIWT
ncbi:hypothetical protein BH24ACT7_BH24ACT7_26330 [soil metagenome]